MNLTERDKSRLFMLALVILGIIITLITDSCGTAPTVQAPYAVQPTAQPRMVEAVEYRHTQEDWSNQETQRGRDYEWARDIENFQITCPTRVLRRDGVDFCIVVKCDSVGVALSCNW